MANSWGRENRQRDKEKLEEGIYVPDVTSGLRASMVCGTKKRKPSHVAECRFKKKYMD